MVRLKEGQYNKLLVSSSRTAYRIYIVTQLGNVLVYGPISLFGIRFHFWLHFGSWIKDYRKLIKVQKIITKNKNKQNKILKRDANKARKKCRKEIKNLY